MNRAIIVTEVYVTQLDEHEAKIHAGSPVERRTRGAGGAAHMDPTAMHGRQGVGSALAGPTWRWAERTRGVGAAPPSSQTPHPAREVAYLSRPAAIATHPATGAAPAAVSAAPARTELRIAPTLLRAMETAASARGRQIGEIWAEAAREWLLRHAEDDDPQPPSPATSAPRSLASCATRDRCWNAIDVLLGDLRAPHLAPCQPAAEPAA